LEIFPRHPDLTLHICSPFRIETDFCTAYKAELFETGNVRPVGWTQVNGNSFCELVRTCATVILPSCSEGQAGSVVQCMYAGLMPIVTLETGIDTEDFGITIERDSLAEIERVIVEVSQRAASWHRERSIRTRQVSETKYHEDAFINRWREILTAVAGAS